MTLRKELAVCLTVLPSAFTVGTIVDATTSLELYSVFGVAAVGGILLTLFIVHSFTGKTN